MTKTEHLLTILQEECIETAQRVSKALRFGMEEIQKEQPLTNSERIIYEFNDIVALMEMLAEAELITPAFFDRGMMDAKKTKVNKYLKYSEEIGTLK